VQAEGAPEVQADWQAFISFLVIFFSPWQAAIISGVHAAERSSVAGTI
jgi:hypothetical protein